MKATFQIILKTPVLPEIYLAQRLFRVIRDLSNAIGDYAFDTVKDWITVKYSTAYTGVENRYITGFILELPPEINGAISRRIIEGDAEDKTIESFGSLIQADTENVEALLRYEDDSLIEDIQKYHPEIFELEMKLREVLNYILCYNLKNHDVFDLIREFKEISISNTETKREIADFREKKKNGEDVKHPFSDNFENELFHILIRHYSGFTKPIARDYESILGEIKKAGNDIEGVKNWLKLAVNFSLINPLHQVFIDNVATRIKPIENLRNDIMHNRRIPLETINDFEEAKELILGNEDESVVGWIGEFWQQELDPEESRTVTPLKQAEFLIQTLIAGLSFEDGENIYTDLDFDKYEFDDKKELKEQFLDIINYHLKIDDQFALEEILDNALDEIDELNNSEGTPINPFPGFSGRF